MPEIGTDASALYATKIEHLTESLSDPIEKSEAASVIRSMIDRIVVTSAGTLGQTNATLYGEPGTMLAWLETGRAIERSYQTMLIAGYSA